jgi:hypothetical protein
VHGCGVLLLLLVCSLLLVVSNFVAVDALLMCAVG